MFIQTEETPNPETLKFIPGEILMEKGTAEFSDVDSAADCPFAQALLKIIGIEKVFLGHDFISVTKSRKKDWFVLKPLLLSTMIEHFSAGQALFPNGIKAVKNDTGHNQSSQGDGELIAQIIELLDTRVRPAVAQDGGDITFHSFEDGIVYLKMQGACSGCPSSTLTLKSGIENMLKYYVPEVIEVRAVEA